MVLPSSDTLKSMAGPATDKIKSQMTRGNLDKIFTLVMMGNSVLAVVTAILFFLSSWWIFLILGIVGFPLIILGVVFYKYTGRNPIQKYAINFVMKVYNGIVQKRAGLLRRIYTAVCWVVPRNEWKHINWGYAKLNKTGESVGKLEDLDEEKRFFIQLYNYLATGLGNWPSLQGKNVLELRSGGGGGIDYLSRYLNADLCIGVDESSTQTNAARDGFKDNTKMRFYTAVDTIDNFSSIEQLKDERIDLALSVQSSMHVRDFKKFIQEVDSVLRPGGFFAFADMRLTQDWEQIERDLQSSSMKIMKKEDISNNVMMSLKLEEVSKFKVLSKKFGSIARRVVKRFGIVKDNVLAQSLAGGNTKAMAYILHKVPYAPTY